MLDPKTRIEQVGAQNLLNSQFISIKGRAEQAEAEVGERSEGAIDSQVESCFQD